MYKKQDSNSWSQTLLYSIEIYENANYLSDEIIKFHNENLNKIHDLFKQKKKAKTFGLYGEIDVIQEKIIQLYPSLKFQFDVDISKCNKSRIIVVFNQETIIFCLVLEKQILSSKPLQKNCLEITLGRIQQDLTQTIFICFSADVLNHWYLGESIPFNDPDVKLFNKSLEKFQVKSNKWYPLQYNFVKLKTLVSDTYDGWSILNNKNNSQCALLFKRQELSPEVLNQFKNSMHNLMIDIIIDIFKCQQSELQNKINKHLSLTYQTTWIILQIIEFQDKIKPEIERLINRVLNNIKDYFYSEQEFQINKAVSQIYFYYFQHILEQLTYQENQFSLSIPLCSLVKEQKQVNELKQIEKYLLEQLNKIQQTKVLVQCEQIINEMQQQEIKKGNLMIQRIQFRTTRKYNPENSIQELILSTYSKQFLFDLEKLKGCQQNSNLTEEIKLINFFQFSEKSDILIVKNNQSHSALLLFNDGQYKKITTFENIHHPCFLYVSQIQTLYCFNFQVGVRKVQINQVGECTQDQVFKQVQNIFIIVDIIYLNYNQSFIGITKTGDVVKWTEISQFQAIKALQIDSITQERKEKEFQPKKESQIYYQEIQSCPNNKCFFLSNGFIIDVYDLNYCLIQSLNWVGKIQLFTELFDTIIVDIGNIFFEKQIHDKDIIVITNLSDRRIVKIDQIEIEEEQEGNPVLDLLKGGQVKFGPTSHFLNLNRNKTINIYLLNTKGYEEKIKEYINIRDFTEACVFNFPDLQQCSQIINREEQVVESVLRITYSRVPTQLCTIENNQLIPLINGFRIQFNQNQSIAVPQRVKLLTLGYIEDYLNSIERKIFVISIIGRQSSGKSYLLNRLFGTRFQVAASRCTDGIWASITEINGKEFLILDCECLFSIQRTKQEETQLLAFLAGICDITILNQDFSFFRYLDELLDMFTNIIGKLKGENLFKGSLLIALRDVNPRESSELTEMIQVFFDAKEKNNQSSNLMTTLFNDCIMVKKFWNFEHNQFSKQIEELRNNFLQFFEQTNHWKNGKILIETIKIVLIQLETNIYKNTDYIHQKKNVDEMISKNDSK